MREYTIVVKAPLERGLRSSAKSGRNVPVLIEALGAIPEDDVLQSLETLPEAITMGGLAFPFPQVFRLRRMTLVCTAMNIYSYADSLLTLEFMGSEEGWTWSYVDFGEYILLTNGAHLVYRNVLTGEFLEYTDCLIPPCLCLCEYNGQIIMGGPGESVTAGFTGE